MNEAETDVERLKARLLAERSPRLQMAVLLSFAGAGAFVVSVGLLHAGLEQMGARYFLSGVAGYASFLGLIRLWLGAQSGRWRTGDASSPPRAAARPSSRGDLGLLDFIDAFESPWLFALFALVAGVAVLTALVYASPLLFAELLLDAAVVGAIYPSVGGRAREHWLRGAFRRTWPAALILCLSLAVLGYALQSLTPDAHTLGSVLRSLRRS